MTDKWTCIKASLCFLRVLHLLRHISNVCLHLFQLGIVDLRKLRLNPGHRNDVFYCRDKLHILLSRFPLKWQKQVSGLFQYFSALHIPENHYLFRYRLWFANSYTIVKKTGFKLPVPIMNAKTILSFSTLHKLQHKNLLHNGLLFQDDVLKFHDFFSPK